MMETQTLRWLYVALMAAGALTFWLLSRTPKRVPGLEYMIALLIPVWSGAVYLAMRHPLFLQSGLQPPGHLAPVQDV